MLTPADANVNSAAIVVEATGYDHVRLRLRTPGEPDETTPPFPFVDGMAHVSALGMLAERDYSIDVLVTVGAVTDSAETLVHSTGSLPDWLPAVTGVGDPADAGFIGMAHPSGAFIVDNQGRVRWYVTSEDPVLNNFQAHPSGEYTMFGREDLTRLYKVLDERGDVVRTIGCVGLNTRFHEVRVMPQGDYWVLCDRDVPTDLSSRGGEVDGTVIWTILQHVGADGTLLFEFDTSEHFSLDDVDPALIDGAEFVNMTHGNAIEFDADGNILLSFRNLNEVTKVDVTTGEVVWRLGGRANQFAIDDPTRDFAGQHGVRLVEPGVVQLLDNGREAPSRLVRYLIDEQALTAERVLEYSHASNALTLVGGSTQVLAGKRALVSFGRTGRVAEVDETGAQTFELTGLESLYIFRAFRIPSLYAAERMTE
ncbi:MAG TPA: arylsulfotransferase family protein [Gemmatimonadota bacterium]|nr:arylsulfotransferase family protein [Gemmatimonadota bacterium]